MDNNPFGWLLDKYFTKVSDGKVVHEIKSPFSVPIMDTSFSFSSITVKEVQEYAKQQGFALKKVFVFTAFDSMLNRETTSMKSETQLYIIQDVNGDYNALFFTGCSIDEAKTQKE